MQAIIKQLTFCFVTYSLAIKITNYFNEKHNSLQQQRNIWLHHFEMYVCNIKKSMKPKTCSKFPKTITTTRMCFPTKIIRVCYDLKACMQHKKMRKPQFVSNTKKNIATSCVCFSNNKSYIFFYIFKALMQT
jgi:uncharacterized membrane protein